MSVDFLFFIFIVSVIFLVIYIILWCKEPKEMMYLHVKLLKSRYMRFIYYAITIIILSKFFILNITIMPKDECNQILNGRF